MPKGYQHIILNFDDLYHQACHRVNRFKNNLLDVNDRRNQLPVNMAFTEHFNLQNNKRVSVGSDNIIKHPTDEFMITEFGKNFPSEHWKGINIQRF